MTKQEYYDDGWASGYRQGRKDTIKKILMIIDIQSECAKPAGWSKSEEIIRVAPLVELLNQAMEDK